MEKPLANDVLRALEAIDAKTAAVAEATGLRCPSGCGMCCLTPAVETSVLEVLPMAEELFRRGVGEAWLERATASTERPICPAYEPDARELERGRCGMYDWRPSICRLYAFAGRLNKYGKPEPILCPVHEQELPEAADRAHELVAAGLEIPLFASTTLELAALHPALGLERLPIRKALARALEIVGLERRMTELESGSEPA